MLAAGTILGSYKILAPLGAGGMGEVNRARLIREARSAAALSHPNICMVHEVGEAEDHVYIAMELVEGQPLSRRIGGETQGGVWAVLPGPEKQTAVSQDLKDRVIRQEHSRSPAIVCQSSTAGYRRW